MGNEMALKAETATKQLFSQSTSAALDILRFVLAATVAFGHITNQSFQHTLDGMNDIGVYCVGTFFILSGFTIRAIGSHSKKEFELRAYLAERISRLISVVAPAIAITIALDTLSFMISPDYYNTHWGEYTNNSLARILTNLSMTSQVWGMQFTLFSNSPLWSIGYEAGFYVLWGIYCLASTSKRHRTAHLIGLVAAAIFYGPNVVFMMLFWLLGVALHDATHTWEKSHGLIFSATMLALALLATASDGAMAELVIANTFNAIHINPARVTAPLVIGCLWSVPLLHFMLLLTKQKNIHLPERTARNIRQLGDSTFPLYLVHFPVFVFLEANGLLSNGAPWSLIAGMLLTSYLAWISAPYSNMLKSHLRKKLLQRASD